MHNVTRATCHSACPESARPKSVDLINGSAPDKKSSAGRIYSADVGVFNMGVTTIPTEIHSFGEIVSTIITRNVPVFTSK